MWQLHQRWQIPNAEEMRQTEEVRLSTFRIRRLLVACLTVGMAALAGLGAYRYIQTPNYLVIATGALGGAAFVLLMAVIPREAWRVLLRGLISLGVLHRRRLLLALARRERSILNRQLRDQPQLALLNDRAVADFLLGNIETAEEALAEGLEHVPTDGHLLNNLGVVSAQQDHYNQAAELFCRAQQEGNDLESPLNCALVAPLLSDSQRLDNLLRSGAAHLNALSRNNVGVFYARRGEWELAHEWFSAAAGQDPDLTLARTNLGLVAYHRGQLQEAADLLSLVSRQSPREPTVNNCLGVILASAGQVDQARPYLRRAHRADPASLPIRLNLAATEATAGHRAIASRSFRTLTVAAQSSNLYYAASAHYNLAVCELTRGEAGAASVSAAAAIACEDNSSEAYTVLAVSLWEVGRRAEALSHFQSAVSATGASSLAYSNLGRALLLENQIAKALAVLDTGLELWPDDHYLAFDRATAVLAEGASRFSQGMSASERQAIINRVSSVQGAFGQVLKGKSEIVPEAHINMGLYLYLNEQHEAAAEQFEAAQRLLPRSRELSFLIGTALGVAGEKQTVQSESGEIAPTAAGRGLLRRAVPHLEAACEAREVAVASSYNLGRCLYVLQEYQRALAFFRRAMRMQSDEEMCILAALAAARQAQRIQLVQRTQLMLPQPKREQLRQRSRELLNTAVHYFRQALLRDEMNATLHGNLGVAYMLRNQDNDVEAALRHWERMRAIGGWAMEKRYAQLAQMENLADPNRVGFDDRDTKLRDLDPLRWIAVPPPRPSGIRFIVEPVAVEFPWRLAVTSERLQRALALRDQIATATQRLARLRV